jgi:1-acyl-sn-glycerol-3-phosphate acyltransferase
MEVSPITRVLAPLERRIEAERRAPAFRRDPDLIGREVALFDRALRWFAPEVRGIEHVPATGPVLIVGNHSGVTLMPDAAALYVALARHRGIDQPTYSLAYDALFAVPGLDSTLRRSGILPASPANAEAALDEGAAVVVYPGGDWEACRPWTERRRVELHDHSGFVRVALQKGVPVIPAVAHGGHEAIFVLTRGDRLAHAVGLERFRINVLPVLLGIPFGLAPAPVPTVPLPTKITVELLEPMDWSPWYGRGDDPEVVRRCYDETTAALQRGLDQLVCECPNTLLARFRSNRSPAPPPIGALAGAIDEPAAAYQGVGSALAVARPDATCAR